MNYMPNIGARVLMTGRLHPERTVTGTVTKQYPSYGHSWKDPETNERVYQEDGVCIKVDSIPSWWSYPGTDLIAPDITDIELL